MGFCDQISIETACSATEANKSIGISDIASTGPPEGGGGGVGGGGGWGGTEEQRHLYQGGKGGTVSNVGKRGNKGNS